MELFAIRYKKEFVEPPYMHTSQCYCRLRQKLNFAVTYIGGDAADGANYDIVKVKLVKIEEL